MRRSGIVGIVTLCFVVCISAIRADDPATGRDAQRESDDGGFWPTRRMVDSFLERGADDVARRYELNDEQRDDLLSDMRTRWPAFMAKHRQTVQPLMNEIIEMRLSGEQPTADKAAAWATKLLPILEDAKKNIDDASKRLRKELNEEQRKKLDNELTMFNMGYNFMQTRGKAWKEGKFDPSDWPKDRGPQRRDRGKPGGRGPARLAASQPVIEMPKTAWRKYVDKFAADHELDAAQRRAADAILKDMEAKASPLFEDYDAIVAHIRSAEGAERERQVARQTRVTKDIDIRFGELQQRLQALLTSTQRARGLGR